MKRFALSIITLVVFSIGSRAADVPQQAQRQAAANFWNTYRPAEAKAVTQDVLQAVAVEGMPHLSVFALGDEGFIVLSADDRVRPVLAYSFDSPFPAELHPSLRAWLRYYDAQIDYAVKQGIEPPAWVASLWNDLLYGTVPPQPLMLTNIPAMCKTKWNQSDMANTYNSLCPYDTAYHERTVVGCVATAMAQIMKYWNHPSHGEGSHSYTPTTWPDHDTLYGTLSADFEHTTYMWGCMPNALSMGSLVNEVKSVAKLSYHCGVAVNMMYGPSSTGGSGAYTNAWNDSTPCAENAFKQYFRYDPALHGEYRASHDSASWAALINADLEAGHPILYTGDDNSSGHAFILDGSDTAGFYHFNWGWGGYGDGFFTIDSLAPGGGGAGGNATFTFNLDQSAIFNVFPIPEEPFDTIDFYDTICDNYSVYTYDDYEFEVANADYTVQHLDTVVYLHVKVLGKKYIYVNPNGGNGSTSSRVFCPADSVTIPQCTFTREGYRFRNWNGKSDGSGTTYRPGQKVKRTNTFSIYAQWVDSATYIADSLGIGDAALETVSLGPNPTTGHMTVGGAPEGAVVTVFDAMGRIIHSKKCTGQNVEIDLGDQPSGLFTIQIRTGYAICNRRIIKQ